MMADSWGRACLLVPTRTLARRRLERIVRERGLSGAWGQPVLTFFDFVTTLLRGEGISTVPLDDMQRRVLLERVVRDLREQGVLDALGEGGATPGVSFPISTG